MGVVSQVRQNAKLVRTPISQSIQIAHERGPVYGCLLRASVLIYAYSEMSRWIFGKPNMSVMGRTASHLPAARAPAGMSRPKMGQLRGMGKPTPPVNLPGGKAAWRCCDFAFFGGGCSTPHAPPPCKPIRKGDAQPRQRLQTDSRKKLESRRTCLAGCSQKFPGGLNCFGTYLGRTCSVGGGALTTEIATAAEFLGPRHGK